MPIAGHEGRYSISDHGRVRRHYHGWRRLESYVATFTDKHTRVKVLLLRPGGGYRTHRVDMLVLESFDGPCPAGMRIEHVDGKQANNLRANLRWELVSTPRKNISFSLSQERPSGT